MVWWRIAGAMGALAVMMGAFGAHAVADIVSEEAMAWWRTAAQYQLVHAVALGLVAAHPGRPRWAGVAFIVGTLVFCGSLYTMALTELRILGAITPIGGLCFITGWLLLAGTSVRHSPSTPPS